MACQPSLATATYRFRLSFTPPEPRVRATLWPHLHTPTFTAARREAAKAERLRGAQPPHMGNQVTVDPAGVLERDLVSLSGIITIPHRVSLGQRHLADVYATVDGLVSWVLYFIYGAEPAYEHPEWTRQALPDFQLSLRLLPARRAVEPIAEPEPPQMVGAGVAPVDAAEYAAWVAHEQRATEALRHSIVIVDGALAMRQRNVDDSWIEQRSGRILSTDQLLALGPIIPLLDLDLLPANPACTCERCTPDYRFMRACPDCGNKRCPQATDHTLDCTGSNEPGQTATRDGQPA